MSEWVAIIVPILATIGAIVTSWLTVRASRKKTDADAAKTLTDIAMDLVKPLQIRIDELEDSQRTMEKEIDFLKAENALLHRWAQLLFTQVVEAGHEPYTFEYVKKLQGGSQ